MQAIRVHNRMHQMVQGAQIQVPGRAIFVRRVRLRAGPTIIEPANKVRVRVRVRVRVKVKVVRVSVRVRGSG